MMRFRSAIAAAALAVLAAACSSQPPSAPSADVSPVRSSPAPAKTLDIQQIAGRISQLWVFGPLAGGVLKRLDPSTGATLASVSLENEAAATGVAFTGDSLWISTSDGQVMKLDGRGAILSKAKIPNAFLAGIAFEAGAVWTLDSAGGRVHRIEGGRATVSIDVPGGKQMIGGNGSLWVSMKDGTKVVRIDAAQEKSVETIELSPSNLSRSVTDMTFGAGKAYALLDGPSTVVEIGRSISGLSADDGADRLVVGSEGIFTVAALAARVQRISEGEQAQTMQPKLVADQGLGAAALGGGVLWVLAGPPVGVLALDPETGAVLKRIEAADASEIAVSTR